MVARRYIQIMIQKNVKGPKMYALCMVNGDIVRTCSSTIGANEVVRVELLRVLVLVYSLRRAVTKSAHLYIDSNIDDHALDKIIYSVQRTPIWLLLSSCGHTCY